MKISEYIAHLAAIQQEHGDLECDASNWDGERVSARAPTVDYRLILVGRQSKNRFYDWAYPQNDALRGDKVCRL